MTTLAGKVIIVTGAGKGLGQAYARYLAANGAQVLVNNRRHPGEADLETSAMKTVNIIRAQGGKAEPDYTDVSDLGSGATMVDHACQHFGNLHGIVANAGIEKLGRFESLSDDAFNAVFNTSFFGNLHLVRAAWQHWQKTGYGRAVLTTSGAGLYGNHGQVAYSAAKAAVIGLVQALAIEAAGRDICINALAPYAYTAMTQAHLETEAATTLSADDIAPLVGYLMDDQCTLSGETLVSAGGYIRRAYTREGPVMALDNELPSTISALVKGPAASYPSASASFQDLYNHIRQAKGIATP